MNHHPLNRRHLLQMAAAGGTAALWPQAQAQSVWPSRAITLIAPNAPGGPADTLARVVTTSLSQQLGTSVVVDNKPGAAGKIGIQAMLRAPRDGHVVAVTSVTAMSALPVFDPQVGYRSPEDFEPLVLAVRTPAVWCVHPSLGVKNLAQLVALAKSKPGVLNYASFGTNSSSHLAQEDFFRRVDIRLTHVPYKGESEGMTALLSNQVQVMMISGAAKPHVEAGKLTALATTSADTWEVFPKLVTASRSGVLQLAHYSYEPWLGFSAAAGTPAETVTRLQNALRDALRTPEAQATLGKLGYRVVAGSAQDMRNAIEQDMTLYRVLLRSGRVSVS
ncbi:MULTISPECIES: Bug family tripartite tricarboxylate transporter substrate binding protein [Hydrogenophaga]|uniref:Bug family tripartite tricarboxylate transporter substrate binding protein n=2 Tax=Hydrogenophaga TaxID=47420 RepID=A0ABW2QIV9_9BURK